MNDKHIKIAENIVFAILLIMIIFIVVLGKYIEIPKRFVFIFPGFALLSSGILGLFTDSILFTKGAAFKYKKGSIIGKIFNILLCLFGCVALISPCIDI